MQVHGVGRHPPQGRVGQDEHRTGVADGCRVLLVESRQGEFFARVEVVVAEDEQAFSRAAGEVEPQSAVVPPGVGMGDVAQADDRVAGSDPAAPLGEECSFMCVRFGTAGSTPRPSRGRRGGGPTRSTCVPGPGGESGWQPCQVRAAGPAAGARWRRPRHPPRAAGSAAAPVVTGTNGRAGMFMSAGARIAPAGIATPPRPRADGAELSALCAPWHHCSRRAGTASAGLGRQHRCVAEPVPAGAVGEARRAKPTPAARQPLRHDAFLGHGTPDSPERPDRGSAFTVA